MNTPVFDMLSAYSKKNGTPFHMPGHKQGRGVPSCFSEDILRFDITELSFSDNLHKPEGVIREAQQLAAQAWGADRTWFCVNGASGGIHAAIASVCRRGESLLVARNCHTSIIGGMMLAGARPVYVLPTFYTRMGVSGSVSPSAVAAALEQHPDVKGMVLVSPTYFGVLSDIQEIARILHEKGKILIVDEAHGAHLKFGSRLPKQALDCGADIVVQSAHKTLPALTPGALVHVKGARADVGRLEHFLRLMQTTSPSYLVMAFLDYARAYMQQCGAHALDVLCGACDAFRGKILSAGLYCNGMDADPAVFAMDTTRIMVHFGNKEIFGFSIDSQLQMMYNIYIEMADLNNILAIATVADGPQQLDKLADAVCQLATAYSGHCGSGNCSSGNCSSGTAATTGFLCDMQGLDSFFETLPPVGVALDDMNDRAGTGKLVPLCDAAGHVSLGFITPYPPGIPLVCPGEVITPETVRYISCLLDAGGSVPGVDTSRDVWIL